MTCRPGREQSGKPVGAVGVDRHAYAARISKDGGEIDLLALDPEDEGRRWVRPEFRPKSRDEPFGERWETGEVSLPSPEVFTGRVVRRLDDRAVAWAGA